jgi:hypothetical protein
VVEFLIKQRSPRFAGGFFKFSAPYLKWLPIPRNELASGEFGHPGKEIIAAVDRMLALTRRKHSGKLAPSELDRLEREIAATDEEIDELVYSLYGITSEERKIIEGQEST